ncbi:hypothetical protein JOE62_001335 [Glutamicibacter nicotianae]|nr:hypothetical protein [Glutamicibacter nicotianae]
MLRTAGPVAPSGPPDLRAFASLGTTTHRLAGIPIHYRTSVGLFNEIFPYSTRAA